MNERHGGQPWLKIDIARQQMTLTDGRQVLRHYPVSTAANGPGELIHSECTPRGWHVIRAAIGAGQPTGTVFVARRPTGEVYRLGMRDEQPGRDWILTRILWLSGLEPGRNRGGDVDTFRRYIYIHGSPDETEMGIPGSRGCVRMHNADLEELFDLVEPGTRVQIV